VAVCAGRPTVWNSRRGNHLGQRSCATAYKGRTYDRKRSDQNSAQQSCEPGAIHIWLILTLRGLAPRTSFWREAQFDTIRLNLIKVAARVTEMVTRIKVALPSAFPYQAGFTMLAGRIAKLPP
jgi:Transposase DDE domain group 1